MRLRSCSTSCWRDAAQLAAQLTADLHVPLLGVRLDKDTRSALRANEIVRRYCAEFCRLPRTHCTTLEPQNLKRKAGNVFHNGAGIFLIRGKGNIDHSIRHICLGLFALCGAYREDFGKNREELL
jgi:hypothetical protein